MIFRSHLKNEEKANWVGFLHGKPDLKPVPPPNATVVDLIGSAFTRFLDITDISSGFLSVPASEWGENEDYCEAKLVVDSIQVVN